MADILIRGVDFPEHCDKCWFMKADEYDGVCCISDKCVPWEWKKIKDSIGEHNKMTHPKPDDCPLQELPPHGRLIDAKYVRDKIIQKWMYKADDSHMYKRGMEDAYEVIRNAPTVIPADEDGET